MKKLGLFAMLIAVAMFVGCGEEAAEEGKKDDKANSSSKDDGKSDDTKTDDTKTDDTKTDDTKTDDTKTDDGGGL